MVRKTICLKAFLLAYAVSLLTLAQVHAQCKPPANQNPPLSPPAQASVTLNGKMVSIDYCAPSLKGRTVGGQIAPYNKVWRTGANTSTTLHTDSSLRIGKNLIVPAGTYTLYSIPAKTGWTLIVNKQSGQWGTEYHEDRDLGRVKMMDGVMPSAPVETFKIIFVHTRGNKTLLHLQWGLADVYVPIEAID
jgi:hypothetical protein